jgi:hypothetical protein
MCRHLDIEDISNIDANVQADGFVSEQKARLLLFQPANQAGIQNAHQI